MPTSRKDSSTSRPSTPRVARSLLRSGAKFDVEVLRVTPSAGMPFEREVIRHPGSVVVLPVVRDADGSTKIVFIRSFRLSLEAKILQLPAGTLGKGEDPARCAARELEEETGYRAEKLLPLTTFYTAPGLTDESMHAFLATDLARGQTNLQEDEDIEVVLATLAEAIEWMSEGELCDAKSMLVLLWASSTGRLIEGC